MLTQRTDVSNKTKNASEKISTLPYNFSYDTKSAKGEEFMIKTCYLDMEKTIVKAIHFVNSVCTIFSL